MLSCGVFCSLGDCSPATDPNGGQPGSSGASIVLEEGSGCAQQHGLQPQSRGRPGRLAVGRSASLLKWEALAKELDEMCIEVPEAPPGPLVSEDSLGSQSGEPLLGH